MLLNKTQATYIASLYDDTPWEPCSFINIEFPPHGESVALTIYDKDMNFVDYFTIDEDAMQNR